MSKVVVLGGMGSVGRALAEVLARENDVHILDKKASLVWPDGGADFLHVAIPYSGEFVDSIVSVLSRPDYSSDGTFKKFEKKAMMIIHSTVPVGTTSGFRKHGIEAVHCPVRGQHDDLADGIRRFEMPIGCNDPVVGAGVREHLLRSGIPASVWGEPEETEMAKLLCLSRYLNDLAFYEEASRILEKQGIRRDILKKWTEDYNRGYRRTKNVRPDLDFPNGRVGGTCVIPVSKMLYEQTGSEWLKKNLEMFGAI